MLDGLKFKDETILVFDDFDKMFEAGSDSQAFSIARASRPDKQTVLICSSITPEVEILSSEIARKAIRVTIEHSSMNQCGLVFGNENMKSNFLGKQN